VSPARTIQIAARRVESTVAGLPANLVASGLMVAAFVTFAVMAVLIRTVGATLPVIEVIFVRQCLGMLMLAPLFWRARASIRRSSGLKLHIARGVSATFSMLCGLSATLVIPLADVTAIQMAEVLIVTALAAAFLGEKVGWRRWLAACTGFAGVLVMVRPFGQGVSVYAYVALASACFGALNMLFVRAGAKHDSIETVLFWQGVVVLALVTPLTLGMWVWPTPEEAALLVLMSAIFTLGLWLITAALRMGETSALAPLHYLRLIMMGAAGFAIYGEVPTVHTIVGAALVLTAATYTIKRNAEKLPGKPPAGDGTLG
jgi:drug/metabolite transporter (DMT)-like permease